MSFSFGIVGGGWYGCHIASSLIALGFEVELFEQHGRLLHEASGNNQFRLHQGFHYARHSATRIQSRDGYSRFIERYPELSTPVSTNIYAVPERESLIDYDTYRIVMTSTGLHFEETPVSGLGFKGIAGAMKTSERVLNLTRSRSYFERTLAPVLRLGEMVESVKVGDSGVRINARRFDFMIDASWGHLSGLASPIFFEPTILLYYEGPKDFPALTLVDGPLCSIYPTEAEGLFTLSSVPHTPLGRCATAADARTTKDAVNGALVSERRRIMEDQLSLYFPEFRNAFRFVAPQLSIKTKPVGAFDDRSCHVFRNGPVLTVLSGKIDTIFFAVERILSFLEAEGSNRPEPVSSSIRDDIHQTRLRMEQN